MTDYGHEETDKQLKKLERKIHAEYEQASKEVQTKLDDYLRRFQIKDSIKREAVAVGEITQEEYTKWRTGQIMIGKRWEEMRDTLAQDLTNTDKIAMSMVRGYMPEVYALNHNYGTFEAEKESMIDTSYTLYDRQTVENLIKKNPDLLPKPSVDIPKDLKWNKQKITSAITQGILQGEDIRKISKRLRNVTDMDKRAAIRNARTMTTSAENAGRSDSYTRAREMGIEMEQIWLATLDERTRDSHRKLDGEKIKVGDKWHHPKFSNGLRYPGDPEGPASEVYNCRCTLIAQVAGINLNPSDISKRNNYKLGGMSYEEWKEEHQQRADARTARAQKSEQTANTIINGKDISETWKRRPDQFDFEIEDVINAQGFDGKPRVVSAEEFDRYVQEANGGNGFIAQRSYSAPDQETLDAYRDQLYHGKWYVDCSTGGAQYGQGMYCAADYTGKLTTGIRNEMAHYQSLNDDRNIWARRDALREKKIKSLQINEFDFDITDDQLTAWKTVKLENIKMFDIPKGREHIVESFKSIPKSTRQALNDVLENIDEYVEQTITKSTAKTYVETITLDPSAKVITYKDLQYKKEMQVDKISNEILSLGLSPEETKKALAEHPNYLKYRDMDDGSFAALLGYDAINAEGHGQSGSYTVILNRTKVIFKGE